MKNVSPHEENHEEILTAQVLVHSSSLLFNGLYYIDIDLFCLSQLFLNTDRIIVNKALKSGDDFVCERQERIRKVNLIV